VWARSSTIPQIPQQHSRWTKRAVWSETSKYELCTSSSKISSGRSKMSKVRTSKFERIFSDNNTQISRKNPTWITPHPFCTMIEDIIPSHHNIKRVVKSIKMSKVHSRLRKKTRILVKIWSTLHFIKDSAAVYRSREMKNRCTSRAVAINFIARHPYNRIFMYFLLPLNTLFLRRRKYQWVISMAFLQVLIHILFNFLPIFLLLWQ
jgi:hypothetical protein